MKRTEWKAKVGRQRPLVTAVWLRQGRLIVHEGGQRGWAELGMPADGRLLVKESTTNITAMPRHTTTFFPLSPRRSFFSGPLTTAFPFFQSLF